VAPPRREPAVTEVLKAPRRFLDPGWGDTASAHAPWVFLPKRARLKVQVLQYRMGKAAPEVYGDIKTIRQEPHPLDAMTEEERLQATIELVQKVRARLDQARALGLLPPKTTDAEFEDGSAG
jgi:hypothetical protein